MSGIPATSTSGKMRLVGVIRLSKETEESTSPQVQQRIIQGHADLHNAVIVGWAEDLDVSATKYAPHQRPELRKWLDKPDEWDGLLFMRLDRFVRSTIDFADMIRWCQPLGKNLVSATEPIDLSTPIGRALAQIIVVFAELEAATTKLRVLHGVEEKRLMGRWTGGDPTYGYKTVPARDHVEGCTWDECGCPRREGLQIGFDRDVVGDATTTAYVNSFEVVTRLLRGDSMNSVCLGFERRDILAPSDHRRAQRGKPAREKRAQWCPETIRNIATSPTIRGLMSHNGEVVHGPDGMPVRVGPAMVTDAEAAQLQILMEKETRTRTEGAAPLLDVGFCLSPDCGLVSPERRHAEGCTATGRKRCACPRDRVHGPASPGKLYVWRVTRKLKSGPKAYRYYRCENVTRKTCTAPALIADDLEAILEATLLHAAGDLEVLRKVFVAGEDHTEEIEQRRAALSTLTDRLSKVPDGPAMDAVLRSMGEHTEAIERLEKLPQREATWHTEPTGETCAELWARLDWADRRRWLMDSGAALYAVHPKQGFFEVHTSVGQAYQDRQGFAATATALAA
ncbi:recombinase family protein [Streptomyces sp. NPDC001415]